MLNLLNPCLYIGKSALIFKILKYNSLCLLLLCFILNSNAQTVSFPDAEGFGKYAKGGRGGIVYTVTNLNDDGSGSFREACEAFGPRTIVFAVSGIINLESNLVITNDNLTIAGQTAPGDGICIKGAGFIVQASDVIVRYLRFRLGDNGYKDENGNVVGSNSSDSDTVGVYGSNGGTTDVIFDHCSLSWSIDEIVGIYGNSSNSENGVNNITFQYCIFSEALSASHHDEGSHSMAFLMNQNSNNITIYKNLFANSRERHIRSGGGCSFEMINNVVYNFRYTCVVSAESEFSMINNHYKEGNEPISSSYIADYTSQNGFDPELTLAYITGNTSDADLNEIDSAFIPYLQSIPTIDSDINLDNGTGFISDVLENSGAILPKRDSVDQRIINSYTNNTGNIIDTQEEVGGYPIYNSSNAPIDSDSDGMPDLWEDDNGLDKNDASDRNNIHSDGYTNLEYYLNNLFFLDDEINSNAGSDQNICEGSSTTLTASGGNTYLWSTGETTQTINVSPSETTTYSVTAYVGSESDSDEVIVNVNQIPSADAGVDQTICSGETIQLAASGGNSYLWNTGATTATIDVSPNTTVTYSVTVTNNGCSDIDDVLITVNSSPTTNAGNDVSILQGASTVLIASGGDSYLWSTGETTQSINVSPAITTTYSVTAFVNGCEASDEVIVTVNAEVVANAGDDVIICENSSVILTASGGTDYLWSTGATTQSINVSPNITTTYSVTVSNSNDSDTDDVVVTVNPNPIANAGTDVTISQGETTTLTASGGTSYLWSTGETTESIEVNPASSTTYTVIVVQNGCEDSDDVIVTVETQQVIANAGSDANICEGDSIILTASGGTTYLWSTGETTQSITVNPSTTTNYSVIVSNDTSSDTDDVTVEVSPLPELVVSDDTTILEGNYITLSASGADSYEWSNGATEPNIAVSPTDTTTYEVAGYINNCYDVKAVTVNIVEQVVVNVGEDVSLCFGEELTLNANSTGAASYLWNTGETTQSINISPEEDTLYTVIASNSLDSDADEIMVSVAECQESTEPIENELVFKVYLDSRTSDDKINIKLAGLYDSCEMYLFDISGKLIFNECFDGNDGEEFVRTIDTSAMSSGVYLIKIVEKSDVYSKNFVLK